MRGLFVRGVVRRGFGFGVKGLGGKMMAGWEGGEMGGEMKWETRWEMWSNEVSM